MDDGPPETLSAESDHSARDSQITIDRFDEKTFAERPPEGVVIPDRVTLLADVAEIVSRSHDLNETLNNVVDLVGKRLDADACSIYLTDTPEMRHLSLSATIGLTPGIVTSRRASLLSRAMVLAIPSLSVADKLA